MKGAQAVAGGEKRWVTAPKRESHSLKSGETEASVVLLLSEFECMLLPTMLVIW